MRSITGLLVAVVVAGCSSKPLQDLGPTGSGGIGSIALDAGRDGFATDAGGSDQAPADAATDLSSDIADVGPSFTGRRSFVVTAQFQPDTAVPPIPTSHTFTMMLDADQRSATLGDAGEGVVKPFDRTAGGVLHIGDPVRFNLPRCLSFVEYDDLTFTFDSATFRGAGQGRVTILDGDLLRTVAMTMILNGTADAEPPVLRLSTTGDVTNPFVGFYVESSEPLPRGANPVLTSASGETITLLPGSIALGNFAVTFGGPGKMRRYSEQYQVAIDGLRDYAGNLAAGSASLGFTTSAVPPLAAEDGFESIGDAVFGGAQVLSGSGEPTITGARSLYVPSLTDLAGPGPALALRLARVAGDKFVRFSYRLVNPAFAGNIYYSVGSEGGSFLSLALHDDGSTPTAATIGGTDVSLGPIKTATVMIPPDATTEVVFGRYLLFPTCDVRPISIPGIIIDDLRAE